ncbi:MAG: hypothetical protein SGARI_007563, partial [Bacillariaceae sp.]
ESKADASWKGKPLLIMMSDAFGPFSGMHRKLADEFALETGGIVLLPDPFEGTGGMCPTYQDEGDQPNQLGFNIFTLKALYGVMWKGKSFAKQFPWDTNGKQLYTEQVMPFLAAKGVDKFALMGFCYGSWYTTRACNEDEIAKHITCAIHFHPSVELIEKFFGGDDVSLCGTCQKPQMIHATKDESDNWKPNGAAHKLLEENDKVTEVQFTIAPPSQSHGFMTRADTRVEENKAAVKEGVDKAVAFMKKYSV